MKISFVVFSSFFLSSAARQCFLLLVEFVFFTAGRIKWTGRPIERTHICIQGRRGGGGLVLERFFPRDFDPPANARDYSTPAAEEEAPPSAQPPGPLTRGGKRSQQTVKPWANHSKRENWVGIKATLLIHRITSHYAKKRRQLRGTTKQVGSWPWYRGTALPKHAYLDID